MRCPFCNLNRTKVIDSRVVRGGDEIRRRRQCDPEDGGCDGRFTTFERVELRVAGVVKKDGRRVPYDREKVRSGLLRATWKTRIGEEEIEEFLNRLERKFAERLVKEVPTDQIGQQVLIFLKARDPVAYIRFMSVYGDFTSSDQFKELIDSLDGEG